MEHNINIQVPITITYDALEAALKKKMVGEYIPPAAEKNAQEAYARIQDISVTASTISGYNLFLALNIRVLRTLLKRDSVDLYVPLALGYDHERQQLFVKRYKVDVKTSSGFYNSALEVLANKVAYEQIMKKARFDVGGIIAREVGKVNAMLEAGLEVKGVTLTGRVAEVRVTDVDLQADKVSLMLIMQGDVAAEIKDLLSLMPPQ